MYNITPYTRRYLHERGFFKDVFLKDRYSVTVSSFPATVLLCCRKILCQTKKVTPKMLVLIAALPALFLLPALALNLDGQKKTQEQKVTLVAPEEWLTSVDPNGYQPTWDSLDSRPLPSWYDKSKFGIFIHWGVFSVPAVGSEWFWHSWREGNKECVKYMENNYPPKFTYQDFGPQFKAEFYHPYKWSKILEKSGAKYVVLNSKHHEGFTLWPSKYAFSWNAMSVGPKRDLVDELANAIRETTNMHFGLYHSLYEWYNPLWEQDKKVNFTTDEFVRFKTYPELIEIVNKYKPEVLWSDGDWEAQSSYWKSTTFLAWLFNQSPVRETVVTNDRWGKGSLCKHGSFYTCSDHYNPGKIVQHKWENCLTTDRKSWGYRQNAGLEDYRTPEELLKELASTVSCGGNMLLNIGPTKEGIIPPIQEERLLQLGEWLQVNGDSIYETIPWTYQNDTITSSVWYTQNPSKKQVYAIVLKWPGSELMLGAVDGNKVVSVHMFGYDQNVQWKPDGAASRGIRVAFPPKDQVKSSRAWVVVLKVS